MIRIITKEDHKIKFNKSEILLSNLLKNMFYNEDNEKDTIQDIKINKISILELGKIKALLSFISIEKISFDKIKEKTFYYNEIVDMIKITPIFTCEKFFKLMDIVNFLDIEILLFIMKTYIIDIINDYSVKEVCELFKLKKEDFSELQHNRISIVRKLS